MILYVDIHCMYIHVYTRMLLSQGLLRWVNDDGCLFLRTWVFCGSTDIILLMLAREISAVTNPMLIRVYSWWISMYWNLTRKIFSTRKISNVVYRLHTCTSSKDFSPKANTFLFSGSGPFSCGLPGSTAREAGQSESRLWRANHKVLKSCVDVPKGLFFLDLLVLEKGIYDIISYVLVWIYINCDYVHSYMVNMIMLCLTKLR